jgi:mannose-6-phosphate isomerase-like protein (cupin superfamily)
MTSNKEKTLVTTIIARCSLVAAVAFAGLSAAIADDEGPAVPLEKAPFHQPVFKNEWVMVLKIDVPPHRNTGFHTHTMDSVSVNIEAADMSNTLPGQPPTKPQRSRRGQPSFTAWSKQPPRTHMASNMGETPFHNVTFVFNAPQPSGLQPPPRGGAYTEIMDNERVRGWRLVLEPGETAAAITQAAPGLRIVLDGTVIAELVPGQPDRGLTLRQGEFYWQDAGTTRAVKNTGTTRLELFEFEMK